MFTNICISQEDIRGHVEYFSLIDKTRSTADVLVVIGAAWSTNNQGEVEYDLVNNMDVFTLINTLLASLFHQISEPVSLYSGAK